MSAGEMCVLIPNCGERHVDKFNQLRLRSTVPRCLFGPPDPQEIERMFQEHMKHNRERMLKKYNVDILQHGPPTGTQLLLVVMKQESDRLKDKVQEECVTAVRQVTAESRTSDSRIPEESSGPEDNFRPIHVHKHTSVARSERLSSRSHPYAFPHRQSQLTEFWRCRRHLSFDAPKNTSSVRSLPLRLLSVPRFEEERRRN